MKNKVFLLLALVTLVCKLNAQNRNLNRPFPEVKKNTNSLINVEKNKVLYQIDSIYYDNDSTTTLPPPPAYAFTKEATKKYSSIFDKDGIGSYVGKEIPDAHRYILLVKITTGGSLLTNKK